MTLLEKVVALLKLDDNGKVERFFSREISNYKREINVLEHNQKSLEFAFEQVKIDLTQQIEDAKASVEEAFTSVDVEKLKNNTSMDEFRADYWNKITSCENKVKLLEKQLEEKEEDLKKQIEEIAEQITKRKQRISKLSE